MNLTLVGLLALSQIAELRQKLPLQLDFSQVPSSIPKKMSVIITGNCSNAFYYQMG
jgi:hypothetical protein